MRLPCPSPFVLHDLQKKMVFVGGPRQVGKTTFARSLLARDYPGGTYLNWDFDPDRRAILERRWTGETPLLVFDVVGDVGARFENLVATHLFKRLQFLEDRDGYRYELNYLRDKEGREVDFVIVREGVVEALIEAKVGDETPSRGLRYYRARLRPQRTVLIVLGLERPFDRDGIRVTDPISYFCADPPWARPAPT